MSRRSMTSTSAGPCPVFSESPNWSSTAVKQARESRLSQPPLAYASRHDSRGVLRHCYRSERSERSERSGDARQRQRCRRTAGDRLLRPLDRGPFHHALELGLALGGQRDLIAAQAPPDRDRLARGALEGATDHLVLL